MSRDTARPVDKPPAVAQCDDCQEKWLVSALKEPQHLEERMDHPPGHPDRIEPAGECPGCGLKDIEPFQSDTAQAMEGS